MQKKFATSRGWDMHRIVVLWSLFFAGMLTTIMPAAAVTAIGYAVPACTGNAATDTATLKSAFARGGLLLLPECEYVVSATLRLPKNAQLLGAGYTKTVLRSVITNGSPLIDSAPNDFASGIRVADIGFKGPYGNGQVGTGDALLLYGATNIAVFERLSIEDFGGNAFTFKRQSKNPGDPTTLLNAEFDTIIIHDVGGYAFDIQDRVHATWNNIEINSPMLGGFRFRKGGTSNSTFILITDLVAQWQDAWSSKNHVVVFDIANYQPITLVNCVLSVSAAATATNLTFMRTNSTNNPNFLGCQATGSPFKYWLADTKNPQRNIPYSSSINYRF